MQDMFDMDNCKATGPVFVALAGGGLSMTNEVVGPEMEGWEMVMVVIFWPQSFQTSGNARSETLDS